MTSDPIASDAPRRPTLSRDRALALALLCVSQTFFFVHFRDPVPRVVTDNARYEEAAWQLVTKGRMLLPYSLMPDETVRGWVCARHPDSCVDGLYPTAAYPPGYSLFIAAIYRAAGRSLAAIVMAQYLLLLLLFVLFERVAHRLLAPPGYWFVIAVAATYPFIARQASMIMSDQLHVVLLFAAPAALLLLRPSPWRGALFGALFTGATLVRPYSLVCLPVIFLWPGLWRGLKATRADWLAAAGVGAAPFVVWAARNFYWFGKFIPLTTTGLGASLYVLMMEWQKGTVYGSAQSLAVQEGLNRYGDPTAWGPNHLLAVDANAWLAHHLPQALLLLAMHVPKVWISLGTEGQGVSRAALLFVPYLGGLLVLGVWGMWLVRRDRRWLVLVAVILPYWAFVLPWFEARRTLPLRLPMLLFAGVAFEWLYRRAQAWRARSRQLST
jgi:hypothetical protein